MIPDETTGEALDAQDAETADELDDAIEAVAQSLEGLDGEDTGAELAPTVDEPVLSDVAIEAPVEKSDAPVGEPQVDETDAEEAVAEPESEASDADLQVAAEEAEPKRRSRIAWWPFIVYGVLWLGLLGASYVLLTGAQTTVPAFRQDAYPFLVLAGLVLTLLGPIMSLMVWLLGWFKAGKGDRDGLLTTALVRGALVTFLGVALWWGMLVLVDALRLGLV